MEGQHHKYLNCQPINAPKMRCAQIEMLRKVNGSPLDWCQPQRLTPFKGRNLAGSSYKLENWRARQSGMQEVPQHDRIKSNCLDIA